MPQVGSDAGREIELGGLLLPHLQRAVTISNLLDIRTIEGISFDSRPLCGVLEVKGDAALPATPVNPWRLADRPRPQSVRGHRPISEPHYPRIPYGDIISVMSRRLGRAK